MRDSDYYPPGAYNDPRAPYNQIDSGPIDVEVTVSQTLSKNTSISTTDYIVEGWEDAERDEDGYMYGSRGVDYIFENADFAEDYKREHHTPLQLIEIFSFMLVKKIEALKATKEAEELKPNPDKELLRELNNKIIEYKHLMYECDDWVEDDFEVCE